MKEMRRTDFAEPYGQSSLRAASKKNLRDQACPTCGRKNALTRKDVALGYQCNACAKSAEGRGYGSEY
jgi:ribosomal protein L37AE/L43A